MSQTTRFIRLSVRNLGQAFACQGVVTASNGRILWTGPERPYGCRDMAYRDAFAYAEDHRLPIDPQDRPEE